MARNKNKGGSGIKPKPKPAMGPNGPDPHDRPTRVSEGATPRTRSESPPIPRKNDSPTAADTERQAQPQDTNDARNVVDSPNPNTQVPAAGDVTTLFINGFKFISVFDGRLPFYGNTEYDNGPNKTTWYLRQKRTPELEANPDIYQMPYDDNQLEEDDTLQMGTDLVSVEEGLYPTKFACLPV